MPTGLPTHGVPRGGNIEEQFLLKLDSTGLDVGCLSKIRRKPFIVEEEKSD